MVTTDFLYPDPYCTLGVNRRVRASLVAAGFRTVEAIRDASNDQLHKVKWVGPCNVLQLRRAVGYSPSEY